MKTQDHGCICTPEHGEIRLVLHTDTTTFGTTLTLAEAVSLSEQLRSAVYQSISELSEQLDPDATEPQGAVITSQGGYAPPTTTTTNSSEEETK